MTPHRVAILLIGFVILGATPARAQDQSSVVADLAKSVALDPTTYAPGIVSYESLRLDWNSSQVFFQHGVPEHNSKYTISGRPDDVPISYAAGNQRILHEALTVLQVSVVNNVSDRLIERVLIRQHPEHRRLFRTLGWAERIAVASYLAYQASYLHFRQWQINGQVASQLGYK